MGQPGTDSVRLLSEQTFETLDRFTLDPFEMACSLLSTSLGNDAQRVFYIVGTAMVRPEERESEKVMEKKHLMKVHMLLQQSHHFVMYFVLTHAFRDVSLSLRWIARS